VSDKENYEFVLRGKVFAGSDEHAKHSVFWAIRNSEWDGEISIDDIKIERVSDD
jgi:hypothetical protein